MRSPRFTIRRLMAEVVFAAVLLAPVGYAARHPPRDGVEAVAWMMATGWVGTWLLIRWVYRDFRNPFG